MHDSVLEDYVNQLYRTTAREEDYVNPIVYGVLSWRSINSDMSYLDIGVENVGYVLYYFNVCVWVH